MSLFDDAVKMGRHVDEFQKRILDLPCAPQALSIERYNFRMKFMREELEELETARENSDYPEQVDALVDLIYVALGALLEMGAEPSLCFDRVHAANMQKVRGVTKRGESYDAVKPEGWTPPDMDAVYDILKLRAAVSPSFLEATRVREERGARYNQGTVTRKDHFPFSSVGHAALCWIKMIRLRSDVEGGANTSAPELSEHIRDLQNYLAFWWEELNGGIR